MNVRLVNLASPSNFEDFIMDECYEMQENKVPHSEYCYELYYNHSTSIYKMLLDGVNERKLCSKIEITCHWHNLVVFIV